MVIVVAIGRFTIEACPERTLAWAQRPAHTTSLRYDSALQNTKTNTAIIANVVHGTLIHVRIQPFYETHTIYIYIYTHICIIEEQNAFASTAVSLMRVL